jgi:hypothetical protein
VKKIRKGGVAMLIAAFLIFAAIALVPTVSLYAQMREAEITQRDDYLLYGKRQKISAAEGAALTVKRGLGYAAAGEKDD